MVRWSPYPKGTQEWRAGNGKLHRLNGPAVIWPDGTKEWWRNGKRHRLDGPAIVGPYKESEEPWYLKGKLYYSEFEFRVMVAIFTDGEKK